MKKCVVASLLVFGMSSAAFAATADMWFVTVDTVGNCSVGQGKPSAGQTALGETGGYASVEESLGRNPWRRSQVQRRSGIGRAIRCRVRPGTFSLCQ